MGDLVLNTSSQERVTDRGDPAGAAAPSFLERWTRFVLRLRWVVLAGWAAAAAIGVAAAVALPGHTANSFAVPGTESDRAAAILAARLRRAAGGLVHASSSACATRTTAARRRRCGPACSAPPRAPAGSFGKFRAGGGVVYGELQSALQLQDASGTRSAPARPRRSPRHSVIGEPAVAHDLDPQLARDLRPRRSHRAGDRRSCSHACSASRPRFAIPSSSRRRHRPHARPARRGRAADPLLSPYAVTSSS